MKTRNLILAAILAVAFAASAQAAAITWTDGTFTSDAILPTHDVGYAVGFGNGTAVTTANGVTFGADNQTNVTFSTANNFNAYLGGGGTTGDPGFDTVLNHGDWGIPGTLTLNNLVIGAQYQVMLFVDDTRFAGGCCAGRTGSVSDGPADGSHSSSTITFSFAAGSPAIGAYYSGTFTANATTQQIVVNNGGGNQIDGLVLVAPEPASLVLFGLGAVGLLLAARRRRGQTALACCLVALCLTQTASAANINVLLSSNGGVADINGSSTGGFGTVAANLIDGNTDGNYGDGSVAHSTAGQPGNYMEVKTPTLNLFQNVEVFNRTDCCTGRLDGFGTAPYTLTIYDGAAIPANITFTHDYLFTADITGTNVAGQTITLPPGIVGNLVRITQNYDDLTSNPPHQQDYLNLAELQAFGQHVPEPSSVVLCGLGTVGLLLAARRRRKA